ncbi:MAG: phosphate acyltransferase, partial [Pseudomonadota bacterium]|nr:phosphate acyltransferase [Pseudomonadota bacterium]
PNQVNNVLCFPYLFRGALDVGATAINEEMKMAVTRALAEMTKVPPPEAVAAAYGGQELTFGPEYLIPKPFDPRLILELPVAVAQAAMDSGVATRPIQNFDAYREQLGRFVYRTGMAMRPVFERAKQDLKRVIYCEAEEERVLRAVQTVVDERLARPVLIGRRDRVLGGIDKLGLHLRPDQHFELIDPWDNPHYEDCWKEYFRLRRRHGVDPSVARIRVTTRTTVLGALLLRLGHGDALLCGTIGRFNRHLEFVQEIIGRRPGACTVAAMNMLITAKGTVFMADTNVALDPSAEQLADITLMAAAAVRHFGIEPKVALLSHSNFGSRRSAPARKMARALELILERAPELEAEGEMQGDTALLDTLRERIFPDSRLTGSANLLIMPNLDAASIAFNLLKVMAAEGIAVGPILLGLDRAAHVLTRAATARRIVNMTAVAAVDAQVSGQPSRLA